MDAESDAPLSSVFARSENANVPKVARVTSLALLRLRAYGAPLRMTKLGVTSTHDDAEPLSICACNHGAMK